MRDTKRMAVMYSFYDRTGIAGFLEEQAKKGWVLEKIASFGWKFRRIEPKQISYAVTYFAKASAFDPEPTEGQLRFWEYCEHTGWKLAGSSAQMQIFYNEEEHPLPIETDAMVEVDSIHAAARKGYLPAYYLLLANSILQMVLFFQRLRTDAVGVFSSNSNLFTGVSWMVLMILVLSEICGYYRWHKRAKQLAELDGSFLETRGHKNLQLLMLYILLLAFGALMISYGRSSRLFIGIASILGVLVTIGLVVLSIEIMRKLKISAGVNRVAAIVVTIAASVLLTNIMVRVIMNNRYVWQEERAVEAYEFRGVTRMIYKDTLPLRIEDLMETAYEGYSYEWTGEGSILASDYTGLQYPRMDGLENPELEYRVVDVKLPLLYDWCKEALLEDFAHNYGRPETDYEFWRSYIAVDTTVWGAKEAYQLKLGEELQERYLICYEDRIVEIDFDWDVTEEQMEIAAEKLKISFGTYGR